MSRSQSIRIFKGITLIGVYGGLLMPLVFIPTVIFPFVFSKLIFFQILIGLTFPAYLALIWMEPSYRPKKHILLLGILAYFVAISLSVLFAVDGYRAWWGNQERMNGLFTILHFLAWLLMSLSVIKTWKAWKWLLNYEVVLSGLMAIVAIWQRFNPYLLQFKAGPRVGGLLDNPIYMAAYQIFNLSFLALLAWKTKDKRLWVLYSVIALLDVVAFILTKSRGALLGLGVGLIAFTVFMGVFHKKKKVKVRILSGLVLLMVLYGALFAFRGTNFVQKSPFARYVNLNTTLETRLIAWDIAWNGFLGRPLTGWGFDDFHILFNERYNPESLRYGQYETWFDRAHNTVLDVLSMTGIIGFLTFIFVFIALFYSVIRAYRRGWIDLPLASILFSLPIAYFFQNLFVFDHPAGFSMSFLMYALVITATSGNFAEGGVTKPSEEHEEKNPRIHATPWAAFTVLQILALLLVWRTSVIPFQVSAMTISANNLMRTDFNQALDLAKKAHSRWTPYPDEQAFIFSRNLVALAPRQGFSDLPRWREAYDFAVSLNDQTLALHPRNTNMRFVYARLLHAFDRLIPENFQKAEQAYLDAIATSEKRQQLHYSLARLYLEAGKNEAGIAILKNMRDLDDQLGEGHWRYGLAELYTVGNMEEGAKEIALSQSVDFPFRLSNGRELIPLFDTYIVLNDSKTMDDLIVKLPDLPQAEEAVYAQIIAKLTITKMDSQREVVRAYAKALYPDIDSAVASIVQSYNAKRSANSTSTSTK